MPLTWGCSKEWAWAVSSTYEVTDFTDIFGKSYSRVRLGAANLVVAGCLPLIGSATKFWNGWKLNGP